MSGFETLLREHHALVYRVALGILKRPDLAEDAAQEVFLDLWRRPTALDPVGDPRAFLAKCAVNRALRSVRDSSRRSRHEQAAKRGEEAMRGEDTIFRAEIRRKVGELPEEERLAVDLHYFQGLTLAQAAVALEVTDRTVSNRLRAALERLKKALGAAAFLALLAGLESELRNVSAEPVPEGARERLERRLSQEGSGGEVGAGRRGTKVALSLCVVLVLTWLGASRLLSWRDGRGEVAGPEAKTVAGGRASENSELRRALAVAAEEDLDRDRDLHGIVVTETGTPVSGARVQVVRRPLTWGGAGAPDRWGPGTPGAETRTRPDGTFRIRLQRRETVDLMVAEETLSTIWIPFCRAGERVRVVLPPGNRIVVRVQNEAGAAVPGARIRLVRRVDNESTGGAILTETAAQIPIHDYDRLETTGPDGIVTFGGVPDGETFEVCAAHPDFDYQSVNGHSWPGRESEVTLKLLEGRTIRGRVVDSETGAPIAGVTLRRFDYLSAPVALGPDGLFELHGWLQRAAPEAAADGYTSAGDRELAVDTWEIRMRHEPVATGRVIDPEGRPIEGALVCQGTERYGQDDSFALSDASGRFSTTMHRSRSNWELITIAFPGRGRVVVNAEGDEDRIDLGDVVLAPARGVEGRLLEHDGSPARRTRVILTTSLDASSFVERITPEDAFDVSITDDLGRFSFDTGLSGKCFVFAYPASRPVFRQGIEIPAAGDLDRIELRLPPGTSVRITAVDDEGSPLPQVAIRVKGDSGEASATTGSDGSAPVVLTDEEGTASGTPPRGYFWPETVPIHRGDDVRLVFPRGGLVSGVIVPEPGAHLSMQEVQIWSGGIRLSSAWARMGGGFEVVVPRDGSPVDLLVESRDSRWSDDGDLADLFYRARLPNVSAGMSDLRVPLKRPVRESRIRARVVSEAGAPVAGIYVRASRTGERPFASAKSGEDGIAEVQGLIDETLEFRAEPEKDSDWATGVPTRVVPAGQEIQLVLRRR